jgi:hypothetical protein
MPGPISDADLFAYLAGVLDPGRAREIEEKLSCSATLAARLNTASMALRDPELPGPSWRIPPPGLAGGRAPMRLQPEVASVMADGPRPGDRVKLWIRPTKEPESRIVVVLMQKPETGWTVVFPSGPGEEIDLASLPSREDGARRLDVVLQDFPGTQRWAVALPAKGTTIDWEQPDETRWSDVKRALECGEIPVSSVEISLQP